MLLFEDAARIAAMGGQLARPVAPHVAGEIARLGVLAPLDLLHIFRSLTPGQLAGLEALPGKVPIPAGTQKRFTARTRSLDPAGRRLLLTAALSTTDRLDVVLVAAATDPAVLFSEDIERILTWENGRYAFRSESSRSMIIQDGREDVMQVHGALAHTHRQRREYGRAVWHVMQRRTPVSESAARTLISFGEQLLAAGSTDGAYRIGRLIERGTGRPQSTQGALLAARAALGMGCFEEAATAFETLMDGPDRETAVLGLEAARGFLAGAMPGETLTALADRQVILLRSTETAYSDRGAVAAVEDLMRSWNNYDDDEVDAIQARLMLTFVGSRRKWPWETTTGPVSPIIEGYIRGQQSGLLLLSGAREASASTLREALIRLPMTHLVAGTTASALYILRDTDPALWEGLGPSLMSVSPARPIDFAMTYQLRSTRIATIAHRLQKDVEKRTQLTTLTPRENEIVDLVGDGLKSREIGEHLGIAGRTVEIHLGRIFRKLGINTRGELISIVLQHRGRPPLQ
ncbi:DNA-binding CsgD family transcriptional regulator [Microbacterium resistens]|uniref:DNA-binding CsgD family transcriptional regulator n=1 Tax=Microbacterium resistens TaxID=156977 RepID=A0ABU1S910_9MICO|nr:LuxR C-terminal-related transcriptional regulator [Microbacterium resistens]MDR6865758.1 DNA-binding CsgD family transcriptional regulator [Microbacterium resistens]